MDKWFKLLNESRRRGYQKRIRSYVTDRNAMLNKGGQKNTPPYTKKMGSHVTFDKQTNNIGEEIEVDKEGFKIHDELNPEIWEGNKAREEIRVKLLEIANDFIEGLPVVIDIDDIVLTGSLANYNWSKYSDADLHIVVDFDKIGENRELIKGFFDAQRMRWNDIHDIKIKDFDVEIYVEDSAEKHHSTGIYSLMNNGWITHPQHVNRTIDIETALKKANDIDEQTTSIQSMYDNEEYEKVIRNVDRIKTKIRSMRAIGLESDTSEQSSENIAFKILRRSKVLSKLSNLKYDAYDKTMTMDD